jgi:hypothetical protein
MWRSLGRCPSDLWSARANVFTRPAAALRSLDQAAHRSPGVHTPAGDRDHLQRAVELTIAATIQAVAIARRIEDSLRLESEDSQLKTYLAA